MDLGKWEVGTWFCSDLVVKFRDHLLLLLGGEREEKLDRDREVDY